MIKLREKIFICVVIVMMVITQIPSDHLIYAQTDQLFEVGITDVNNDYKKINVSGIEEGITKIGLFLNDKQIQSKEVSSDLSFDVYANGTYEVKGFDANDAQKSEESIEVKTFADFTVEKNTSTHVVKIVSRHNLTEKIVINKKDEVKAKETQVGYYEASYTIPKNGNYTFDVINFDGQEVASKTMKYTDVPNVSKTGEFIISSEADLKQINANPSGTFVLENDIELTSNSLKDVNFTGTLEGNGYMISGFTEPLFNSVKDATINSIVIKGSLAKTSTNTTISNTGFYVEANDDKKDSAVILKSDNTTINNSFALLNVEGKIVSGFILEGTGTIENSYVSGYLKGEEVYGFGKEVDVKNSYITASLVGKTRTLFTSGEIEESFYDAQINDLEELKSMPMYTKDLISKDFQNEEFKIIEGQYPQIKNIEEMKEKAQAVSTLSVQSVKTDSNLSTLKGKVETNEDSEEIEWDKEKDEVSAKGDNIINRFALKEARAVTSTTAGESTTATKTQITYPITMGTYYKVLKTSETAPILPTTHKEAIELGWKIMYWDGNYKQAGLEWNTQYNVYSTNLNAVTTDGTIKTNIGKNGGKVTLSGTYDEGQVMTATLSGTNTTKGTMYFESAATLDATTWTEVTKITMDGTSDNVTYTVAATLKGKYLRTRFVADQTTGYQGTIIDKTKTIFKEDITGVTIKSNATNGKYTLNDELVANMTPTGRENDVVFKWYHSGDANPIATGRNYKIKASDIGKQLYVQAVAKVDGDFKGTKDSALTSKVQPIKHTTPTTLNQLREVSKDDITVTLTMDVTEGLYRYGYRVTGTSDPITPYSILARNQTNTTITGLQPNTSYDFYVQLVGEEGFVDSDWSADYITITTDKEHVKGDVGVLGNTIYNETLTASLKNHPTNQTGQFVWYRLDDNGARTVLATNVRTYKTVAADIGKKIEVAYEGNGSYAGEISTITDTISKEEIAAPTINLTVTGKADTTITVKMPTNSTGEKYIVGISQSKDGVPIELLENNAVKELASGASYTITGLDRDTTYFLYVRHAENAIHQKSDWIVSTSAVSQKTDTKAFTGNITFTYETTNLMRGQTLTAKLNPTDGASFNFKGEWTWTRIDSLGKTSDINNFTLTSNKEGTQYVVPLTEEIGVTYKVTFTANVGYTGSVNATSTGVHDIVKEQYQPPNPDFFELEQIDDTSLRVGMVADEGKYRFWYKKADQTPWDSVKGFFNKMFVDPNDGFREVKSGTDTGVDVLANSTIVITGLDRNTNYLIRAQRVGDDKGTTSEFSGNADIPTKRTEIAGHVTIEGTTRFGQTLTATYNAATYASTGSGSDTEGKWQWYRGTTPIASATNAKYIPAQADIGQVLTVKYSMPFPHDFEGEVEAKTGKIEKAMGVSPTITGITSKEVSGKMTMTVTGTLGTGGTDSVYYRLQKAGDTAPTNVPTFGSTTPPTGWHQVTNATMVINKDANNLDLVAKAEYTIYFIKTATATAESTQLLSQTHKMGTHQQIGTITFTKPSDTTKQAFVVGQTVKANLSTGSNSKGTWKWYMSTTKFTGSNSAPSSTASTSWKEITSGFSQTTNNMTSSLSLSEDMFGYFIRAEFVASEESGFSGSISSVESQYVRKIYDEKLTITSSTKDGNGNPKAYANTKITGTIDNYAESGNLNRATVRFKVGTSTYISPTITNGTFTYTMSNTASYDGQEITAEVSTPRIIGLYVDTNLKAMSTKTLNSKTSTTTSMFYTAGVPISSADDMKNFMLAYGNHSDRSETYVLTDNIKLGNNDALGQNGISSNKFLGSLDGDFHTLTNLKNQMFKTIGGTTSKFAVVKNLISYNSDIEIKNLGGASANYSCGMFGSEGGYVEFENVILLDSKFVGYWNTGYFLGRPNGTVRVINSGAAGGSISITGEGASFGGIIGFIDNNAPDNLFQNIFTINTAMVPIATPSSNGGISGSIGKNGKLINVYTANDVAITPSRNTGPVIGPRAEYGTYQNVYYNEDSLGNKNFPFINDYGTRTTTEKLVGDNLKSNFDSASPNTWRYKTGYYPQLKWIENISNGVNIVNLYTATRGAFTSVDGSTSSSDMFNGRISGSIQIPAELLTKDFTVTSSNSNILKVKDNGTIIPVATGTATITITYTEPDTTIGGTASNTFDFTVIFKKTDMGQVQIANSSGTVLTELNSVAPQMNQTLTVKYNSAIDLFGPTYKWYRRKSGSTIKETISGATGKTYQVKASDVGYEISVLVSAGPHAPTYSNYTKPVESITPTALSVSSITDSSVRLNANGNSAFQYEFGYLRSDQNALITPIDGTYAYNAYVTINNLQRNKAYKFYTRIAAASDGSYPASAWSSANTIKTLQTNITGTPILGTAINNGADLSLNMATTNGQTGTWKLERMNADGTTKATDISFNSSDNEAKYTLTAADVGYRIRATFTGNGDFQGSKNVLSGVIQKAASTAPSKPILYNAVDETISILINEVGKFDVAIATTAGGEKRIVSTNIEMTSPNGKSISIPWLEYNTDYYIFIRKSETTGNVASAWSDYLYAKTARIDVHENITITGTEKVDENITFTMPYCVHYGVDVTGTWKLERVRQSGSSEVSTTISPSKYTASNKEMTYTVDPKDAGSTLRATYTGNGDFQGSKNKSTLEIANAEQGNATATNGVISDVKDHSLKVQMSQGSETYQFGYRLSGASNITAVDSMVVSGTDVLIEGLKRNSSYVIYVRHAAKTGYNASGWNVITTNQMTDKSALTGTVEYVKVEGTTEVPAKVGVAEVNATYKAKYKSGTYDQTGTDTAGNWQWYADGSPIPNATSDTYTIEPMTNVNEITVRFIADDTSDFKEYRSASIGTLTKPAYEPPTTLPTVTAKTEDGNTGSKLFITSSDIDNVFYYVQKADNAKVPATILASSAGTTPTTDKWFKANTSMTLNVEANTSYVVFVARLEDGSHLSSGVISRRAVKTVKDDISQIDSISITEADATDWKVLQDKELRIHRDNKPVDGVWQYYVSQTKDVETSWQNITAEVKVNSTEGNTNTYTYTKVNVPLKYANGYYFRAVFTGRGDLEGSKTYTSTETLKGTLLKGSAVLSTGNTSQVFVPIEAKYVYAKDNGADIVDEENGIWTWYREETGDDTIVKKGTVGISDTYTPTVEDVNKRIYATYSGAPEGIYSGYVTSNILSNVTRATQNTPNAITQKQVSGTSVQINLPTNMNTTGKTVAQPQLEYRVKNTSSWTINSEGDAWITGLKANTEYEVRVRFLGTGEYEPSSYGTVITVRTGNQSFDEENLEITQPSILESGNKITATFRGSGYDEGYFVIKRSDGTTIKDNVQGTVTRGFLFKSSSTSIDYTITSSDIGSNIIIEFKANADAPTYGGSIEKSTKEVAKPINPTQVGTPTLDMVQYDETVLRVEVNDTNEYVFNDSATAVDETSGDWQKLTKDTGQTYHTFTGLDKTKDYYLHVRTAETQNYRYSKEDVSAPTKPWASSQYAINYEGVDGGATNGNPANPTQYTELSPTITLNDASKNGYEFTGWTTDGTTSPQKGLTIPTHSSGEKKFTAHWKIITYDITYNGGGTFATANPTTYTVVDNDITLNNPTRDGYDFTGWTGTGITGDPQSTVTIPKGSFENKVYTANWKAKDYTISYTLDGGTNHASNPTGYTIETNTITLQEPKKTGYTFDGWTYDGETTPQKIVTIVKGSTGAKTYTANWTINKYLAKFDSNGGTPDGQTIEQNYLEALGTLPEVTRTGYTFKGWYPNADGTGTKIETTDLMPLNGATYYAQWTINKYTVSFDANGGNAVTKTITENYDSELGELPIPTKTGYRFDGWFTLETGGDEITATSKMPAKDTTYFAQWTINQYTVSFDSKGGSEVTTTIKKDFDTELGTLPTSTKTGYEFDGWFTLETGGDVITATSKIPAKDTTYFAHWTIKKYTVTYDSKEGSAVNSETLDYDKLLSKPEDPTRTGYRFGGWFKEDTYKTPWDFANDKIADANITLYAKWDQIYQLLFDKNTGVGSMNNVEFILSDSITLPKNTFTKEGFAFTGWNTQADGNGTTYTDQQILDQVFKVDTTLYATWKTQAPSVFIDIPKGLSLMDDKATKTAIKEDEVKIVKNPEDSSWYPDEDIQIRTSTNITLSNEDDSQSYEVEVFKADGSKYTDQALPLAVLNVKDDTRQSVKFILKTPMNYSKPKGIYKGSMNFIIEFVPNP